VKPLSLRQVPVVSAIIPCLDEETAIGQVVAAVRAQDVSEVVVVDGGSQDRTAERAKAAGSPLQVHVYPGASHNYDDPGKAHQSVPANHKATEDTFRRAEAHFAKYLLQ